MVLTSGGVHSSADTGDVTAIPTRYTLGGNDYATAILLINDHGPSSRPHGQCTHHAAADTANPVTVGAMTVTAGFNTLINEMITKYPSPHRQHHLLTRDPPTRSASSVVLGQVLAAAGPVYPDGATAAWRR